MPDSFTHSSWNKKDDFAEIPLRPQTLSEFVGQESVVKRLEVSILADKQRTEPLGH